MDINDKSSVEYVMQNWLNDIKKYQQEIIMNNFDPQKQEIKVYVDPSINSTNPTQSQVKIKYSTGPYSIEDLSTVQPMVDTKIIEQLEFYFKVIKEVEDFKKIIGSNPTTRILPKMIQAKLHSIKEHLSSIKCLDDLNEVILEKTKGIQNLVVRGNDPNCAYGGGEIKYIIRTNASVYNPETEILDQEIKTGTYKIEQAQTHNRYVIVIFTGIGIMEITDISNTIWVTPFEGYDRKDIEKELGGITIPYYKDLYSNLGMLELWNILCKEEAYICYFFENGKCIRTK